MLYYVLIRSEDHFKMQYNTLIELINTMRERKSRQASTDRKNRPESTSAAQLKLRNQGRLVKDD